MPTLLSRRRLLGAAPAAALGAAAAPVWAQAKPDSLTFVGIGDWGRDGASHQRDVAGAMGRAADAANSRFTISVGDNFYEDGVRTARDSQWRTSFEDIYTAPSLRTPWYVALGNHDYRGDPQAQVDYARASPRWKMPSRYYKVSGAEIGWPMVDLFVIDTSPVVQKYRDKVHATIADNVRAQDLEAQLAWLDTELGKSTAGWKLVIGHHTIYSGGSGHGNTPEMVARIKPILERRGVNAYINGHDHDLQHIRVGAIDYICTGAGSEVRPTSAIAGTRFCAARSGFAVFTLTRESLGLTFRDVTGAPLYTTAIARARV